VAKTLPATSLDTSIDPVIVALCALTYLPQDITLFQRQGMDPWLLFSFVPQVKVHADLQTCLDNARDGLRRYSMLTSRLRGRRAGGQDTWYCPGSGKLPRGSASCRGERPLKGGETLQGYINQHEIEAAGKGQEELPVTTTR
jgi:hypothetical protein